MRHLLYIILATTLCLGSCGGKQTGEDTEGLDSDSIVDLAIDTLMAGRLEGLVSHKVRMTDEQLSLSVYDLTAQQPIYAFREQTLVPPASCLKLLTAVAALKYMGMNYEYHNRLSIKGDVQHGILYGSVILQAEDDPLFESFEGFAQAIKGAGIRHIEGDIVYDLARTDTLKAHASAKSWDIPYNKLPVLLKGEERVKREFMAQLTAQGIKFKQNPVFAGHDIAAHEAESSPLRRRLAIDMVQCGSTLLAEDSHRLTDVITPMLLHSSNIKADALIWHLNHVYGRLYEENPLHAFMKYELDTDYAESPLVINDGSGLSPDNRLTTDFLICLLRYAYGQKPIFRYLIGEALPTPATGERCGTLDVRMANTPCVGKVFCKTGTLVTIGGSGLAGYAKGSNRHWYAFAILNIDMPVADAREFQDKLCRELVR
ncbi:MAG: D-alanyl-D-alanine carboxypeptidase [Bacteroidaceae bacterium]|nr:D-alanyl-D-alanine carboxypeptidase [Bacteroidaceae bacterium]